MNKLFFTVIYILAGQFANSQDIEILKLAEKAVNQNAIKSLSLVKEFGQIETNYLNDELFYKVTTFKKPENVYNLSIRIPLIKKEINAEQPLLIVFKAKSIEASLETNESKVSWLFKQTESASPRSVISRSVSLSAQWQTYYIPFYAIFNGNLSETTFSMQFGYSPQVFEIKDIELYVFPNNTDINKLPQTKITYDGIEDSAKWRVEAENKIEKIRKGLFKLSIVHNGKPLPNAEVEIKQISHHFRFGTAVNAHLINTQPKYFEVVKKMFNEVVFENDLKIKAWMNINNRKVTLEAIDKLRSNGILIKGHTLLWPGFQYLPEYFRQNKTNTKKIKKYIEEHYKSILSSTKGKISHWDVLNEAYTNKDVSNILGSNQVLFDAFKKCKEIDPIAKRYINEYGILSGGGNNNIKQDWYFNFIKEIDQKTNGAIDGLGMQSHFGTDLTPPKKVMEILDRFSELDKEIAISEFTLDIFNDDDLRAKYTRDYLTVAFSNSAVKEYLFWGFYTPTHPKASLVDENYNLTKMGQAYYDLVFKKWRTELITKTDEKGSLSDRGFYGTYEFKLKHDEKIYEGTFDVLPDETNNLKINLK